jgi:hypothetical protein
MCSKTLVDYDVYLNVVTAHKTATLKLSEFRILRKASLQTPLTMKKKGIYFFRNVQV